MRAIILAAALLCAGCGSYSQAIQYRGVGADRFGSEGRTWRVFDNRDEGKMLVLPLIWRGFSQGLVQGATFGAVRPRLPIPEYQAAAAKWLSDTGRTGCSVSDGYELIDGEWEFSYQCSGIATLPPPRRSGAFPPVTSSGGQR